MSKGHWELNFALWDEEMSRDEADRIAELLMDVLDNEVEWSASSSWVADTEDA